MLVRCVLEHVREQNGTAVGTDVLIAVVGVFVGIRLAIRNEATPASLQSFARAWPVASSPRGIGHRLTNSVQFVQFSP